MFVKTGVKISMHVGTGNKQRFMNINELHQHLGNPLCLALPVFHALTGCDFNPCFFRKGKARPFSILQRSEKYTKAFANLNVNNIDTTINIIEEYICRICGFKKITNINQVRLATFSKIYDFNENKNVLDLKIKKYDGSMLPPCKAELNEQIKRAAYIGTLWRNAHQRNLENLPIEDFGWQIINDKCINKWFEGDQLPRNFSDITEDENAEQEGMNQLSIELQILFI